MEYIKWVIIYLIFSLIFAQCFKETNRNMKNASALTILLEVFTALFALILSPLFTYKTMYDGLTKQEQNILRKIFEQKTREQISEELNIVPRTVDNYLCRIFEKTGCHGIEELFAKFVK